MLCLIFIFGGLLIMMGQHDRSEALFYYFRLEDQVPETHLLRLIEKHISFAFVRETLKASYSDTGRPSLDPELLLRILLIGYLYGITSERKLVEELRMHLAWRWFNYAQNPSHPHARPPHARAPNGAHALAHVCKHPLLSCALPRSEPDPSPHTHLGLGGMRAGSRVVPRGGGAGERVRANAGEGECSIRRAACGRAACGEGGRGEGAGAFAWSGIVAPFWV
jgi:hypothetical protein